MTSTSLFPLALLLVCSCRADASSHHLRAGQTDEVPHVVPVLVAQEVSLKDDAATADQLHEQIDNSFPPFPKPTKDGVGFRRTISELDENTSFSLTFGGGQCNAKDEYGNNACHYNWGEAIEANYTVQLGEALDKGDTLQGNFHVDHIVPYSFSCAVCGEDCVLKVPVANIEWSFPTPPCPINTDAIVDTIKEDLGKKSPTDGIPVHLEGNLQVVRASGDSVAKFSVSVDIK